MRQAAWLFFFIASIASLAPAQTDKLSLSVYHERDYVCEVEAVAKNPQLLKYEIVKTSFLNCLATKIGEEPLKKISALWEERFSLTREDLRDADIRSQVDLKFFKLQMEYPTEWNRRNVVSAQDKEIPSTSPEFQRATTTAYLNYTLNGDVSSENDKNTQDGTLNPVLNTHGIVLESYHSYRSNSKGLSRLATFLTKDFNAELVRVQIGDNESVSGSLYSGFSYLGGSVRRDFGFSPDYTSRPQGEREIFLETQSRVEIFSNGLLIKSLVLEAGRHEIQDIPVNRGLNSITLRIIDSRGVTRVIQFQSSAEENLLKKDLSYFSYEAGILKYRHNDDQEYTSQRIASIVYRYGLSNTWTAGLFSQARDDRFVLGQENIWATERGIFQLQAAYSQWKELYGDAIRGSYIWLCPCAWGKLEQRFTLGAETFSPNFIKKIDDDALANASQRWGVFSSFSSTLTESMSGQINAARQRLYGSEAEQTIFGLDISKRYGNGLFATLGVSQSKGITAGTAEQSEVRLQLVYQFEDGIRSIITNVTAPSDGFGERSVTGFYNNPANKLYVSAGAMQTEEMKAASMTANSGWQFADLSGRIDAVEEGGIKNQRARAGLAGALVYADGSFGVGRQVRNALVVIENERKEDLFVNQSDENYDLHLKSGATRVLTTVQAYQKSLVRVTRDAKTELESNDLYSKSLNLIPPYKQALVLKLDFTPTVTIRGILKDQENRPLPLVAGKIIGSGNTQQLKFFTDYDGQFQLQGLRKEKYTFTVFGRPFDVYELDLSHQENASLDLGAVNLVRKMQTNPQ